MIHRHLYIEKIHTHWSVHTMYYTGTYKMYKKNITNEDANDVHNRTHNCEQVKT